MLYYFYQTHNKGEKYGTSKYVENILILTKILEIDNVDALKSWLADVDQFLDFKEAGKLSEYGFLFTSPVLENENTQKQAIEAISDFIPLEFWFHPVPTFYVKLENILAGYAGKADFNEVFRMEDPVLGERKIADKVFYNWHNFKDYNFLEIVTTLLHHEVTLEDLVSQEAFKGALFHSDAGQIVQFIEQMIGEDVNLLQESGQELFGLFFAHAPEKLQQVTDAIADSHPNLAGQILGTVEDVGNVN